MNENKLNQHLLTSVPQNLLIRKTRRVHIHTQTYAHRMIMMNILENHNVDSSPNLLMTDSIIKDDFDRYVIF